MGNELRFRRTGSHVFKKHLHEETCETIIALNKGDYLSDEVFLSTSVRPDVKTFVNRIMRFLDDTNSTIVLKITIGEDVKAAHDVASISTIGSAETELLVDAGNTYFEYISSELIEVELENKKSRKHFCQQSGARDLRWLGTRRDLGFVQRRMTQQVIAAVKEDEWHIYVFSPHFDLPVDAVALYCFTNDHVVWIPHLDFQT